jgi:hypothetical protein
MENRMPSDLTLLLFVHLQSFTIDVTDARSRLRPGDERGQATTEYALVLLAAALVGLMVVAWATAGGGAARISKLFNSVIDSVIDRV